MTRLPLKRQSLSYIDETAVWPLSRLPATSAGWRLERVGVAREIVMTADDLWAIVMFPDDGSRLLVVRADKPDDRSRLLVVRADDLDLAARRHEGRQCLRKNQNGEAIEHERHAGPFCDTGSSTNIATNISHALPPPFASRESACHSSV
jgi:hypothetical protein